MKINKIYYDGGGIYPHICLSTFPRIKLTTILSSLSTPLPKNDLKSWVGYRNGFKYPASSDTKPFSSTRANLIWLEPFLRFSPSLAGHFQMHTLKPPCDHNFTSRPDLVWSSSSASNSDDFPFFGSSIAHLEPELQQFEVRSIFVGWNSNKYWPNFKLM